MQTSIVPHIHPPAGPEAAELWDIQALEQSGHVGQGMVAPRAQLVTEAWPGEADTAVIRSAAAAPAGLCANRRPLYCPPIS